MANAPTFERVRHSLKPGSLLVNTGQVVALSTDQVLIRSTFKFCKAHEAIHKPFVSFLRYCVIQILLLVTLVGFILTLLFNSMFEKIKT